MGVNPRGLSTSIKFMSQDWLFVGRPRISEPKGDLKIT